MLATNTPLLDLFKNQKLSLLDVAKRLDITFSTLILNLLDPPSTSDITFYSDLSEASSIQITDLLGASVKQKEGDFPNNTFDAEIDLPVPFFDTGRARQEIENSPLPKEIILQFLGCSSESFHKILEGKKLPDAMIAIRLSYAVNCSLSYLLGESYTPNRLTWSDDLPISPRIIPLFLIDGNQPPKDIGLFLDFYSQSPNPDDIVCYINEKITIGHNLYHSDLVLISKLISQPHEDLFFDTSEQKYYMDRPQSNPTFQRFRTLLSKKSIKEQVKDNQVHIGAIHSIISKLNFENRLSLIRNKCLHSN